jgi:hypothetical protein
MGIPMFKKAIPADFCVALPSPSSNWTPAARLAYNAGDTDEERVNCMATSFITPGAAAPPFALTALGSGRSFGHAGSSDALLLVFHDQNTVAAVQQMQERLRSRYADAGQLQIASVVNMQAVPVFLRGAAESVMKGSYAKAAAAMPPGLDAADYVVILLDWDGSVSEAYGARKIARQPRLVLLDRQGIVSGVQQTAAVGDAAQAMVERLLGPPLAGPLNANNEPA